jgi:hypothetical protein
VYAALSLSMLILTALAIPSSSKYFARFYGVIHPMLVVIVATALGVESLWFLLKRADFRILTARKSGRGMAASAVMATCLGMAIILVDVLRPYPMGTNVPIPQALLVYPTIGFVAEVVFHLLPLSLFLLLLAPFERTIGNNRTVRLAIVLASKAEPTFQVIFGGESCFWAALVTWVHVFAIAFLQLHVFRRFGFGTMYVFRLIYYAYWHIAWGVIRLEVLY